MDLIKRKSEASVEFQNGFNDRIKGLPLDESRATDYKNGWWQANWRIQLID